jgi:hypothetical protein
MSFMGERAGAQAGVRVGGRVCGRAGRWAGGVGDVLLVRVGGVALLQGSIWRLEFIASRRVRAARLSALSRAASSPGTAFPRRHFPPPQPRPRPLTPIRKRGASGISKNVCCVTRGVKKSLE